MIFFGIVIGLAIMGAMVYLALDKKSNFHTRLAALIALGIMILTVIICLLIAFSTPTVQIDPSTLIVGAPVEAPEDDNNVMILLFSILILIAFLIMIVILAMRENRKNKPKS